MDRKFKFNESKGGAALTIRVTPKSSKNEISDILDDGTIKIRLTAPPIEEKINQALIGFLSEIFNISTTKIEIVAGKSGKDKLVSIIDVDAETAHKTIIKQLS